MKIESQVMKRAATLVSCLAFSTLMLGCGGASSNDQGVSVTLIGFNIDPDTGAPCEGTEPNHSGSIAPLSISSDSAGGVRSGYVVQNRMTSQFFRTENAFLEYYIPGALEQPPTTAVPAGAVIEKAPDGSTEGGSSEPSRACIGGYVLPPEVQSWIINNRNSMPEPPFQVEVRAYISGMTSSGDRLDTNVLKFFVEFTQDILIDSEGTGGGDSGLGGSSEESAGDTSTTDISATDDGSGVIGSETVDDTATGSSDGSTGSGSDTSSGNSGTSTGPGL